MTVTYLDAGILLAVVRGNEILAERALSLLEDPSRTFAASVFLRLELLPKARYHQRRSEIAFYEAFFSQVSVWAERVERIVDLAEGMGAEHGLNALDALHLAAAAMLRVDEFVTTEGATKPIHRVPNVKVSML